MSAFGPCCLGKAPLLAIPEAAAVKPEARGASLDLGAGVELPALGAAAPLRPPQDNPYALIKVKDVKVLFVLLIVGNFLVVLFALSAQETTVGGGAACS